MVNEIRGCQEGGRKEKAVDTGLRRRHCAYASNSTGFRERPKEFAKYLEKRGLELNAKKTKTMVCRKGGYRRNKDEFKWKGEKIEEVKAFSF